MSSTNTNAEVTTGNNETVSGISIESLKARIKRHYDIASTYYHSLWGEHIHHGYFLGGDDSKERAQVRLIELLVEKSELDKERGARVLDVGCGIGGTSRYLALNHDCNVTGITISSSQVEIARKLSIEPNTPPSPALQTPSTASNEPIKLGAGSVTFIELDAENLHSYFPPEQKFNYLWISEALSHLPNKQLFFQNAERLLAEGGKLVIADWFKREGLSEKEMRDDIEPIEDGMLLPRLCTQEEYVRFGEGAGLRVLEGPLDISERVRKTWDISWTLVQNPALWAFAIAQGRDGLAFLQAFRAMRRGFLHETFRYAVMVFRK